MNPGSYHICSTTRERSIFLLSLLLCPHPTPILNLPTNMSNQPGPRDLVRGRGERGSSPLGTTIFVGLRALDGLILQRALQVWDPLPALFTKLGFSVPPPPPSGGSPLAASSHDLTPFQAIIWAMSIGSAVKQIIWILAISKEPMYVDGAVMISLFNTVVNSFNTLAFSLASVNPTWSAKAMYISVPLYAIGILIELVSEIQRKRFKDNPKNEGKPYGGGLFGLSRSINYFGYTVWRGAFALAGGGLAWGALIVASFSRDFCTRAIPVMDRYCTGRYGQQWENVKRKVPYAFCPGVY